MSKTRFGLHGWIRESEGESESEEFSPSGHGFLSFHTHISKIFLLCTHIKLYYILGLEQRRLSHPSY